MSLIKDLKKLVAKDNISRALEEALALTEQHDLDDLENSFIGLQARQSSVEEAEMEGIMDPRAINMEKARIRKSVNFFLDKLEEELPAQPVSETSGHSPGDTEEVLNPEESKAQLKESLTKRISHLTKKIIFLNDQVTTESNPATKFDIQADIAELQEELKAAREQLEGLG